MNGKPNSLGTVLVVDDEASIRDSLRMILEFKGYRVEEAPALAYRIELLSPAPAAGSIARAFGGMLFC